MNRRHAASLLLVAAIALTAQTGCGSRSPAAAANELRRGNGSEPDSLDPQLARMESALTILRDAYEGLVSLAPDGNAAPGAAESWAVSDDGRRYTFRLRPGARWSNGEPVVAPDFVFAWRRLVDPSTASQYALMLEPVVNAVAIVNGRERPEALGVMAPDDATLVVELERPAAYFPALLSHPSSFPVHRPTLAARPQDFSRPGVAVTNGAFVPAEWQIGSHIIARRNPHYRDAANVAIAAVRYVHVADPVAELTRFRGGELDVTSSTPPGELARLQQEWPGQLQVTPQLGVHYYGLALDQPPFADSVALRRALALAIDRERLVAQVLRDGEQPAYGWVPPGVADYAPQVFDWADWPRARQLAEARRLYAEAGYSAGRPLLLELRYGRNPVQERVALAVTAMWRDALGVRTELRAEDFRVLRQAIDAREVALFRGSWLGDYNDAYSFLQVLQGGFGINLPRYASADYDAALAAANAAPADQRPELLAAAERCLLDDVPLIPLYFVTAKHLVAARVQGWYGNVMNVTYSRDLMLR